MSERENRRKRLLQFDGTPRSVLEARVTRLVAVLDAAEELVAAEEATASIPNDAETLERHERSWNGLLAAVRDT